MKCPNCGNITAEGALFCGVCGTNLTELAPAPVAEPEAPVFEEPVTVAETVAEATEEAVTEAFEAVSETVEPVVEEAQPSIPEPAETFAPEPKPAPVVVEPQPTKEAKPAKKSIGFWGGCKIFFLSILLLILMVLFLGVASVRQLAQQNIVTKMVETVDITRLAFDDQSLSERISEMIKRDVSPQQVEYLLESFEYEEYLASLASDYANYLLGDGRGLRIDVEDIMDLVESNEDVIEEELGFELTAAKKQDIRDFLDENVDKYQESIDESIGRDSFIHEYKEILQIAFSGVTLIILTALMLLILLAWVMTYRKKSYVYRGFCGYGAYMLVFSGLIALAAIFSNSLLTLISDFFKDYKGIVSAALLPLRNSALLLVAGGALILIIGIVTGVITKKRIARGA